MLVVMEAGARPEQIEAVVRHIEKMGLKAGDEFEIKLGYKHIHLKPMGDESEQEN